MSTIIAAIVPAAGRSGRMGAPKQLMLVNGRPMLLGVIDAMLGGAADVTVVTSSALRDALPPLSPLVRVVLNDAENTEMIDSIRIGLRAAPGAHGYLVCPGDAAGLTPADARRCAAAFAETPDRIIIATHGGRRGHPMIFPGPLAEVVHSRECDTGLHHLPRNRPHLVREVECDSPGTVANVNTPADYERVKNANAETQR